MTTITATIVDGQNLQTGATRPDAVAFEIAGLPALTGSPKQVAWATTIRSEALEAVAAAMTTQLRTVRNAAPDAFDAAKVLASAQAVAARLATALDGRTSAAWWIDQRDALRSNAARTIVA